MIFYEAPHRIAATAALMAEIFGGGRRASFCRELTKLNEEVIRTTLGEAAEMLKENARGEYVIAVSGSEDRDEGAFFTGMTVREHVEVLHFARCLTGGGDKECGQRPGSAEKRDL